VAPTETERSLRWARLALSLVERGVLPAEQPTRVDDHLATMLVHRDHQLAAALVSTALAPLSELSTSERERLLETLEAWLAHQRQTPEIAAALHVHPQTVRYRVAKLRELLGDKLDTPGGRFELELALRAVKHPIS
jgi:DNA-binding PucR family transcriptional regulator